MHPSPIRTVLASLLTAAVAAAQCIDDVHPVTVVDGTGAPASGGALDLALPGDLPAGDYLLTVRDSTGQQQLSLLATADRRYRVRYEDGVQIVEALGTDPAIPPLGPGVGGTGSGIPLFPWMPPDPTVVGPAGAPLPCVLHVAFGSRIDLAADQVLPPRIDPFSGRCIGVRSLAVVTLGDGTGSTIAGAAFDDLDADGVRDADEPGAAGITVTLTDPDGTSTSTTTDGDGAFAFTGLTGGVYQLAAAFDGCTTATTPTVREVTVDGCGAVDAEPFGRAPQLRTCDARTAAYWAGRAGLLQLARDRSLLAGLRALPLVDDCGRRFDPCFVLHFALWSHDRHPRNMAYELSVQLAAAYLNVASGLVDPNCMVQDERLGAMTVADLIRIATVALARDGFTGPRDRNRPAQALLRDVLERMNRNGSWL